MSFMNPPQPILKGFVLKTFLSRNLTVARCNVHVQAAESACCDNSYRVRYDHHRLKPLPLSPSLSLSLSLFSPSLSCSFFLVLALSQYLFLSISLSLSPSSSFHVSLFLLLFFLCLSHYLSLSFSFSSLPFSPSFTSPLFFAYRPSWYLFNKLGSQYVAICSMKYCLWVDIIRTLSFFKKMTSKPLQKRLLESI